MRSDMKAYYRHFSIRLKQKSGAWKIVKYVPQLSEALDEARKRRHLVWAIFELHTKILDSREWVAEKNWPEA